MTQPAAARRTAFVGQPFIISPETLARLPPDETMLRVCQDHNEICSEKGDRIICRPSAGSFHEVRRWLVVDRKKQRVIQEGEDEDANGSVQTVTVRQRTTRETKEVEVVHKSESRKPSDLESQSIDQTLVRRDSEPITVILTPEAEAEIVRLYRDESNNLTQRELAERYDCSTATIARVLRTHRDRAPRDRALLSVEAARQAREEALATVEAMDRYLLATAVLERIPPHYLQIARALLDECGATECAARIKAEAAIAALLFWDDAWCDGTNSVTAAYNEAGEESDAEVDSHDRMSEAGDAIMGKDSERPWVKLAPKETA